MTQFLTTAWHVDFLFVAGFIAATGGYALVARQADGRATLCFAAGLALLLVAATSPLDALAREYLLSAHMTQHLLLSQIIPPLLLLGLPATLVAGALRDRRVSAVERTLRRPLVAWMAGIAMLWLWHLPAAYELAVTNHTVRHLHHLSVLLAGLIFWWPIVSPVQRSRLGTLPAVGYLVAACLASTVLGMMLTFAPETVYAAYRQPADSYAILTGLRAAGLTPRTDQQIAGLIMWVPCCLLYLSSIAGVLIRWYAAPEPAPATARA
jgi:cytochrome c oxidase assembly factor CtaG